jgi:hypothetical protein
MVHSRTGCDGVTNKRILIVWGSFAAQQQASWSLGTLPDVRRTLRNDGSGTGFPTAQRGCVAYQAGAASMRTRLLESAADRMHALGDFLA